MFNICMNQIYHLKPSILPNVLLVIYLKVDLPAKWYFFLHLLRGSGLEMSPENVSEYVVLMFSLLWQYSLFIMGDVRHEHEI